MSGWFPPSVSTFGADVDSVFWLIAWIVFPWLLLAEGALLWFCIRYRRREGRPPVHVRGEGAQAAWVVVPALLVLAFDLGIDAAGNRVWRRVKVERPAPHVQVAILARQFNWEVTYPGPDGRFGTADDRTLENVLHVPANRVVGITLTAEDVLHSFFVPSLRLKQDAVPGRRIPVWFEATEPGRYEIGCAELCGFGHYTMRGELIVHSPQSYQEWVAQEWPEAGRETVAAAGPASPGGGTEP